MSFDTLKNSNEEQELSLLMQKAQSGDREALSFSNVLEEEK